MSRLQSGLTLVELIVAVALLALLSVMAYRGLDSMMRSNDRTLAEVERWRATTFLLERFAADVSQPARRQIRGAAGELLPAWWGQALAEPAGTESQLEFSRKSPPGQDESRLGYRLRGGNVELLVWRVLDRAPGSKAEVYKLLTNVRALRFRHLDERGVWQDEWPQSDVEPLPRAVAVELTLAEGPTVTRIFALP
ncbi:MAG: type II secretion system protein GspJ [Betaproteobacteria bacterium RIFCSPLOWO2_12_FULL_63_13]|nr:MAG: type II secretion system protein GspJ [Betaproteobacteria bacterium RIFCSPLOWO2_12_FULL_63_13]